MSSATLPNTLPAPTTAIFATNKSPIRSAGAVAFPLMGSDAPKARIASLEPSPK